MAKLAGPLHSEHVSGRIGGITYRDYSSRPIVSSSRMVVTRRFTGARLKPPLDFKGILSRWSLDRLVTLRSAPPNSYVMSIGDQVGNFGSFFQTESIRQPLYVPPDPLYNFQPSAQFDGVNDRMQTYLLPSIVPQPLDIWCVS